MDCFVRINDALINGLADYVDSGAPGGTVPSIHEYLEAHLETVSSYDWQERMGAGNVIRVNPEGAAEEPRSPRAEVLDEAKDLVLGDRNNQYGPPTQDFQRTADALSALGYRNLGPEGEARELDAHDVAVVLAQVKLSRIMWSPSKRDHWVDLAGYAACGYECAEGA